MMIKRILSIAVLASALLLAACSSETTSGSDSAEVTSGAFEMSPEMKLLIGTLELAGTDQEVDPAQAQELLPLWKMLESLASSHTVAQEELDAVVEQIQETMTSDQMAAIDAMHLTPQEMLAVMQELGLEMGGAGDGAASNDGPDGSSTGDVPGGGFVIRGDAPSGGYQGGAGGPPSGGAGGPPDGFEGGGFVIGEGQNLTEEQQATAQARQANRPQMRLPAPLLEALIEYLKAQAGS
jgi:hypothetical protein